MIAPNPVKPVVLRSDERYNVVAGPDGIRAIAWWYDEKMRRRNLTAPCGTLLDARENLGAAMEDAARNALTAMRLSRFNDALDDELAAAGGCEICDDPACYRNAHGAELPY